MELLSIFYLKNNFQLLQQVDYLLIKINSCDTRKSSVKNTMREEDLQQMY